MNQILTDDEIIALQYKDGKDDHFVFARDIENAILAKLNDTKPVAYMANDDFGVPDFVHACYVDLTGGQLPFPDNAEVIPLFTQTPAPSAVEGWTLVPTEILDAFPEINPSNYDHDDACRLNAWGVELVLSAARSEE